MIEKVNKFLQEVEQSIDAVQKSRLYQELKKVGELEEDAHRLRVRMEAKYRAEKQKSEVVKHKTHAATWFVIATTALLIYLIFKFV
jgi:cytochrome b involved in lipid metabolism